jgi:hypothetical protein
MPRGATPGRNLGKEVATGYASAWSWLPLAAFRHHDPRLFDDRIDGETREQHHQRYTPAQISARGARYGRGARVAGLVGLFSRPGDTKIPIAGSAQVRDHFSQDHR